MANQEHLDVLKQGVAEWNEWRKQYPKRRIGTNRWGVYEISANLDDADLSGVNLSGADLSCTSMIRANLSGADLSGADLSHTHLFHANMSSENAKQSFLFNADALYTDLSGANLSYAFLKYADLSGAHLRNANLRGADLGGTDLRRANLMGADLSGAKVYHTIFADLDLRRVKGLAQVFHRGPSLVTLYTVQLPQDGSALHFLRGTGMPEEWISFWRSTMMHPIQYHSCFISYSSKDEALARRLHADLQDQGVRCWFAPEDLKIGDKIRARIDEAIHLQDKLLLLLSEQALASNWVEAEVEAALEKEMDQQREVLFPVRLDESVMQASQAWAKQLRRTRHIGDFTRWTDPQEYQRAFERLLHDLKTEAERKYENHQT